MPPRRSDPLVLASLLQQWQDLSFLTSGIPIRPFQAEFTTFTDASTQGWGAHMGDSQISGTLFTGPRVPHQLLGIQGGRGCPTSLGSSAPGPPSLDCYGQFDSSFIYHQPRRDPFPYLASSSSGAFYVVTSSRHSSPSKTHSRLSECYSCTTYLVRPNQPISTEWSLHPEIVSRIFGFWGTPVVDMFDTVSNSRHPQFMSPIPEPRALAVDALSQDWQGRPMYMFPPFALLSKVIQKLRSTQEAEVILIAPWWPKQLFPHLLSLCVDHPLFFPYRRDLLSQQDQRYVSDRKSYRLHAWRLSCDTTKQQAFQPRSLGLPQHLHVGDPQPITWHDYRWLHFTRWAAGQGFDPLVPQLLK